MPSLARKILIIAAVDGLILSPIQNSRSRSPPPSAAVVPGSIKLEYRSLDIKPHVESISAQNSGVTETPRRLESHGIVGLLNVSPSTAFLIAITDRKQVAAMRGQHPIYVITNVALIPLSSHDAAVQGIEKANESVRKPSSASNAGSDTEGETDVEDDAVVDDEIQEQISEAGRAASETAKSQGSTSIGEDVIARKGAYGRFAERWFSKRGWTANSRRSEGMSSDSIEKPSSTVNPTDEGDKKPENQPAPPDSEGELVEVRKGKTENTEGVATGEEKDPVEEKVEEAADTVKETVTHSLTPKLLHTTKLLLAHSRSFYFSYEWDITRNWGAQVKNNGSLPLFKLVDPEYFWNRHLQKKLIDSGQHNFVLPLMQGFVGQTNFSATASNPSTPKTEPSGPLEEKGKDLDGATNTKVDDFAPGNEIIPETDTQKMILTLISRRSTHRAGLRYLRRGVDDQGHVANMVETEQILSTESWSHVFSYLQIRGSIPLFFSQSPYSLRPRPVLLLSEESNAAAIRLHFKTIQKKYGNVHIANLVEKDGSESIVGNKYRDAVAEINNDSNSKVKVGWTWFDFHKECRGMRFENVSRLFEEIGEQLDEISYTEDTNGLKQTQKGVLRTNCMDCLDRTNVVQSGSARRALEVQLKSMDIELKETGTEWFNMLWADNGDAISKQYASTAALKGDFTRTRKRNLQGALTDFGLTMSRYFTNIISDFFTQAAIDFLLGNVTAQVFTDFEAEMASGDPAMSMRKIRQNAIEISSKIAIADESEELLGGWTFLAPRNEGTLRGGMVEKVFLCTDKAVYMCVFDWALEKVSAFERVLLEDLISVQWGTYITSTLASSHTDENRNVGFILRYSSSSQDVIRVNTRSLRSSFLKPKQTSTTSTTDSDPVPASNTPTKFWAFKAMPMQSAVAVDSIESDSMALSPQANHANEREMVRGVCEEIQKACDKFGRGLKVKEGEVIGLAEAKKGTGLLEQWGYNIKRLVWA